jgi:hypothetical protein
MATPVGPSKLTRLSRLECRGSTPIWQKKTALRLLETSLVRNKRGVGTRGMPEPHRLSGDKEWQTK